MNVANSISTAPYPGLRPFKQEEAELFFGRETQTNEMLTRLEAQPDFRFLAVIGASGSGKSSLVKAGLLPALSQGFLLGAPADWKFVTARPGDAPLRNLANAWVDTFHPQTDQPDAAESERDRFALAQLRAGPLGLVRAYRGEKATQGHAVLILIDQFEELFRFRRERDSARRAQPVPSTTPSGQDEPLDETSRTKTSPTPDNAPTLEQQRNEAAAFVELLLATARQTEVLMYVVITMRSDFLGDCDAFLGLPEAISRSQYLTPRMTRSQLSEAITRPLELPQFGASIEQTLVTRILNDVGPDPDQLPLMQHALLRTWRAAADRSQAEGALPVQLSSSDYDKSGGVKRALSQDADEALGELRKKERGESLVRMAEMLFRSLAHQSEVGQLVRRPVQVSEVLGVVSNEPTPQDYEDLNQVLATFEGFGRYFLMRTSAARQSAVERSLVPVELNTPNSHLTDFIDISHESLLRQWEQVQQWFVREADAARQYRRLVDAVQVGDGEKLMGDALDRALDWRRTRRTPTWAMRYDNAQTPEESLLPKCLELIEESKKLRDSEEAEAEFVRNLRKVRIVIASLVLASLFIGPVGLLRDSEPLKLVGTNFVITDEFIELLQGEHIVVVRLQQEHIKNIIDNRQDNSLVKAIFAGQASAIKAKDSFLKSLALQGRSPAVTNALGDGYEEKHLRVALETNIVVLFELDLPEQEYEAPEPKPALPRPVLPKDKWKDFAEKTQNELKKYIDLSDKKSIDPSEQKHILALPPSVYVIDPSKGQPLLIQAALNSFLQELLLRYTKYAERILEAARLLVHLLGYFALVFGVGTIYRRFAFRAVGGAADSAARQSPWETRWHTLLFHANEFLERFQSRRWKVILSVVLFLIGSVLFSSGLYGVWAKKRILILGVPLGVILILLVPTAPLLKRSWVPRFKVAQGILLQLCGFYALAGCVYLLMSDLSDKYVWEPDLLLVHNRWVLVIAGIGLVILGKRKCFLTVEETLVREPDRAPIVYLRLFEGDNRNRKETWGAWMSHFFRPNDEQLLRPIFGALGPFVTVGRPGEELSHLGTVDVSGIHKERQQQATQLMRRSALVILQIDDRPTDGLGSKMRLTLQALKPEQVLVYFSQQMDAGQLRVAYNNFVEATRDAIPCALPPSIDSNHFLAFDKAWQPFLCGALTRPKFSWGKVMPLLGSRLDVVRMRRAIVRTLQPFFERRNQVNAQTKLYGDCAIGLAAFFLFGLGFPAGVMIFRNLWRMGRRRAATIGLVAPFVGFVAVLMSASYINALELEAGALLVMVLLGSPFATYWLWRRLSGREIRLHAAFGGTLQPRWKALLLLVAGCLVLPTFGIIRQRQMVVYQKARKVAAEGGDLARGGDLERAITKFQEALKLDPDIDLDPRTKTIEKDPRAVAQLLAARAKAKEQRDLGYQLRQKGDIEKALQAYAEAEKLDPSLVTDARFWNSVAWNVSLGGHAAQGLEASEKAVRLTAKDDPLLTDYRDTRGLARALTGDTPGAIEDFEAFMRSDRWPSLKPQRQQWIDALRKGEQPFTPQLLETLRSQ